MSGIDARKLSGSSADISSPSGDGSESGYVTGVVTSLSGSLENWISRSRCEEVALECRLLVMRVSRVPGRCCFPHLKHSIGYATAYTVTVESCAVKIISLFHCILKYYNIENMIKLS